MEYYLNKHGEETFEKAIQNLAKFFGKPFPLKLNLIGIGTIEFNSRDELYGFIYAFEKVVNANNREVKKKNDNKFK